MTKVRFVASPEGQSTPFIADKLHRHKGAMVPQWMLYPSAGMISEALTRIPRGQGADLASIRASLAAECQTETVCPVTTQRAFRDVAEAAYEGWAGGRRDVVPFWRAIDPETPTASRLPGGADFIRARRAEERA